VHGLEAEFGDQIRFVYLDVDDPRIESIASQISSYVVPELFLVDGEGYILNHWLGYTDYFTLTEAFNQALGN
jgi:hypothetical protein